MMRVFELCGTVSKTRAMACNVSASALRGEVEVWLKTYN